ncbi:MAG: polyprenyl synthetase family protein [Candidatus Omnitrophica bacterium]|nr:polyprenyl synthetase family protein [Candidatus Omnitrophota bacterium]
MESTSSVFVDERTAALDLKLESIFQPVADELELTKSLYKKTVLQTAERNYIHRLLSGEEESYIPQEYRVEIADKVATHLLQSQGKWIRAAIVLLSAKSCGVSSEAARQLAVAVESVHLATLVHDDIIDQAAMRRGVESVQAVWGNSVAVLIGDFLLSKAFKLLLASASVHAQKLLTHATGQMCLGEIKQLRSSGRDGMAEQDYLEMIENKTASLMAAAAASGGRLGDISTRSVECLHAYGHSVGMAFQIADDILDYTASSITLGKEKGGDLRNGKATLPLIHLFQNDGKNVHSILSSPISDEQKIQAMLALMKEMGSIDYAYKVGRRYGERAKENLKTIEREIGASDSLNSLYALVDFVLTRKR